LFVKGILDEKLFPGNITVYEGDNVELICETERVPSWYHNRNKIALHKSKYYYYPSYNKLLILRVRMESEGLYTCKGFSRYDVVFSTRMYLHIEGTECIIKRLVPPLLHLT